LKVSVDYSVTAPNLPNTMTQDQAKAFFEETYTEILKAWMEAWTLHTKQLNHPYLKPSCRAHIIQNLAFGFAQATICKPNGENVRMEVMNQQLIRFGSRVIVGFKKLNDETFTPHVHSTKRSRRFYGQQPLPIIGEMPRLVCGLKINEDWTDVIGCYLMHPKNERDHNWVLNLSTGCSDIDLNQEKFEFEDNEQFFTAPAAAKRFAKKT